MIFKTKQVTSSGDTTIWQPNSGKRWRMLGFHLFVPPHVTLASRGLLTITFRDGGGDLGITFDVWCGQTSPSETASSIPGGLLNIPWVDIGKFGIGSAAVNNPLSLNLSSAVSNGAVRVTVSGLEE